MSCKGLTGQKLKDCKAKAAKANKPKREGEQKESNVYKPGTANKGTVANLDKKKPKPTDVIVKPGKPKPKPKPTSTTRTTPGRPNILAFGGSMLSKNNKKRRLKKKNNRLT